MHTPFDCSLSDMSLFGTKAPPKRASAEKSAPASAASAPGKTSALAEAQEPGCGAAALQGCGAAALCRASVADSVVVAGVVAIVLVLSHNFFGSIFALLVVTAGGAVRMRQGAAHFYTAVVVLALDGVEQRRISVLFYVVSCVCLARLALDLPFGHALARVTRAVCAGVYCVTAARLAVSLVHVRNQTLPDGALFAVEACAWAIFVAEFVLYAALEARRQREAAKELMEVC